MSPCHSRLYHPRESLTTGLRMEIWNRFQIGCSYGLVMHISESHAFNFINSFYQLRHIFLTVAQCKTMMSNLRVYAVENLQWEGVMAQRKKWFQEGLQFTKLVDKSVNCNVCRMIISRVETLAIWWLIFLYNLALNSRNASARVPLLLMQAARPLQTVTLTDRLSRLFFFDE